MSNPKMQPVRGTQDLLPEMALSFRKIDALAFETAALYGYQEIDTPIFEFSEVFHRTLGETSDVVSKETYTFEDRGGESLTLRPEGTAGIARAFISNGLAQNLPLKFYYSGPMFRYERPQKGRYRQFHQLGVECLGLENPEADIECLALGYDILCKLGLKDKIKLELNSLGDSESRNKHKELLVTYLKDYESELSADSKIRLHKNPLRILDSKDDFDRKIVAGAPLLKNCLNQLSQDFFGKVQEGLKALGISYELNDRLVRGLDYYSHTVFEFTTTHLGAQGAVIAGGRYDGLIAQMGGPQTPGVGWASGMERLSLLLSPELLSTKEKIVAILPADESSETYCLKLAHDLRQQNIKTELITSGNVGKKMKRANKLGATYAIIIGQTELTTNTLAVKNLTTGTQENIPSEALPNFVKKN